MSRSYTINRDRRKRPAYSAARMVKQSLIGSALIVDDAMSLPQRF